MRGQIVRQACAFLCQWGTRLRRHIEMNWYWVRIREAWGCHMDSPRMMVSAFLMLVVFHLRVMRNRWFIVLVLRPPMMVKAHRVERKSRKERIILAVES